MFRRVSLVSDPKKVDCNVGCSRQKVFVKKEKQQKSGLIEKKNNSVGTF